MIANCGCDERGLYSGGAAGDQNGREWAVVPWYSYPWNCVLHHPDPEVRRCMATLADASARNDHMGYDQGQRLTYWYALQAAGYDPSKIKTDCEADCSSGVAGIVKATGYLLDIPKLKAVSISLTTYYMRGALAAAEFEIRNGVKYLTSDDYICAGDVLLNDGNHTTIATTSGRYADSGSPDAYHELRLRTLQQGMKGADVHVLKMILAARTFLVVDGKIGGTFGVNTAAAVSLYQKKAGLERDCIVGINTWNSLLNLEFLGKSGKYFRYALKQIEKGTDRTDSALVAQEFLKVLGYYKGELDGIFLAQTDKSVREFQRDHGLAVDGIVGPLTWAELLSSK